MFSFNKFVLLLLATLVQWAYSSLNIEMTKVFIMPIYPTSFNWTISLESNQGYWFRASLADSPDLPDWLSYTFSKRHQLGIIYGVPPSQEMSYDIELIVVNRQTYETQRRVIRINVTEKSDRALYEVQLKIDNVDVEDMVDKSRLEQLLSVFTKILWPQSQKDLYLTFLDSAIKMGARKPLRPNESDGVVLRVGSQAEFSKELIDLQEEVKPLWKLSSCPRDFKRTTVDRHFRAGSFALDWCSFRLSGGDKASGGGEVRSEGTGSQGITRDELPSRDMVADALASLLLPMIVLLLMGLLLSLVLCFHHDGIADPPSDRFFDSLFFCDEYCRKECEESEETLTQFQAVQRATNSLRSLSTVRDPSPRMTGDTGEAGRPHPPPYTAVRRNIQAQDS